MRRFAAILHTGAVVVWGGDTADVPTALADGSTNVTAIACSTNFYAALTADGAVFMWRIHATSSTAPAYTQIDVSNVDHVATASHFMSAITAHGTVVSWVAGSSPVSVHPVANLGPTAVANGSVTRVPSKT